MHTNALIREKSPYLLQHAHNPVDWLPWGEEAFARARAEDKPIFLSVGYSTCHWCHVMERESFENEETARVLNRFFVAIKVDREERPDIDRVYMTFVQAATGSGGWPLSVFLTPELQPFFGGTYFSPQASYGRPSFREVLERVAEAWRFDRARILESSAEAMRQLGRAADGSPSGFGLDESALDAGFQAFRRSFDTRWGGFGSAPKFPRPAVLNFLLRDWARTKNAEAREMVLVTLKAMARGGIHDHLGGGFHRYSVDQRWFVPHFEKMLYDQAQLAVSYLEAYQICREERLAGVARGILDYVLRDMTNPEGGFYSAEDADSPDPAQPGVKREGAFYLWTRQEIEHLFGGDAAERFCRHYGLEQRGNVRDDPHGEFAGRNILYEANIDEDERRSLEGSARMLLEARSRRPRPHLDDKILTGWNGLMISALAKGAQVLEDQRYQEAARRAAEFLLSRVYSSERATLLRRYREGEAAISGFLEDYAFFVQALLDLYETVFDVRYLELSLRLTDTQLALFEDQQRGGFYGTAAGDASLPRMKDEYDGAEPSGNSIAALNLLRLAEITGREPYRKAAEGVLRSFAPYLATAPAVAPQMLASLAYHVGGARQIVLVGDRNAADTRAFVRAVYRRFLPNKTVLLLDGEPARRFLSACSPAVAGIKRANGAATAYLCENYACRLRTTELDQFEQLLVG